MSNLTDALSDLRAALQSGQDRETAVAETADEYGLKRELLMRLSADMPTTPLPTQIEKRVRQEHIVFTDVDLKQVTKQVTAAMDAERRIRAMDDAELDRYIAQSENLEQSDALQRHAAQFLKQRTRNGAYLNERVEKANRELRAKLLAEKVRRAK